MNRDIPNSSPQGSSEFQQVVDAFLPAPGLPFANILSAEPIERIFAKHGCLFGMRGVYTAAIMVWSFLSQVLRDGKEASCQAAVARVASYCEQADLDAPAARAPSTSSRRSSTRSGTPKRRLPSCSVSAGIRSWIFAASNPA